MTDRATCWSVTINNPTEEEYSFVLPAKWKLTGQLEKGEQGTVHYQGMLTTPQTRFSAVKKVFPRAHIEVARNKAALQKYVQKEDTRLKEVTPIPTLFEYQTIIAGFWNDAEFDEYVETFAGRPQSEDELAMRYLDRLVAQDIESGRRGAEFIAINPMWRSSWKYFWRSIIKRHAAQSTQEGAPSASHATEEGFSERAECGNA